jgi:hypothetical protein
MKSPELILMATAVPLATAGDIAGVKFHFKRRHAEIHEQQELSSFYHELGHFRSMVRGIEIS